MTTGTGLKWNRFFTAKQGPYDDIIWTKREVVIRSKNGIIFEQRNVEAPSTWSDNAVTIVASKYFRGQGTANVETSVRHVIDRVVRQTGSWAKEGSYFASVEDEDAFCDDLTYLLVHQMAVFNSPVWFNLGWEGRKQAVSACYINSVSDSMDSILDLVKTEGMLFKDGSGSGTNLSNLRSRKEVLSAGGHSSGPVSFMKGYDAFAGVIKSGGGTRRAACMRVLDADHPDIMEFIDCKVAAEKMAHALIDAGFSGEFNADDSVYSALPFQNANHSVRVTDDFMRAVVDDKIWHLNAVTTGAVIESVQAKKLWRKIAEAAHFCGDPGLQFDTTTNAWHTSPNSGRINSSNPCCLMGDTLVETMDGWRRIDELVSMSKEGARLPDVASHDTETNSSVLNRTLRAWCSGQTTQLIQVTTQRGITIRCTPEHQFLLTDESFVEARKLLQGNHLRGLFGQIDVVRSIEHLTLENPVDVFDLEVEGVHNFAVSSKGAGTSIIVHNSEFVYLDDTSCNLSSINLMKFVGAKGEFQIDRFIAACRTMILAKEIFVGFADYPTPRLEAMSHRFRPLGLGFSNLGALFMHKGLAYDSVAGRNLAAAISSLMTASAYKMSGEIAEHCGGPFEGYAENVEPMMVIVSKHFQASTQIDPQGNFDVAAIASKASLIWHHVTEAPDGFRNGQLTLIAPTGTISFMMDCDTTGIEPDIALVKYKKLVGGGTMKIVNGGVAAALRHLGYSEIQIRRIEAHIEKTGTIENATDLEPRHVSIFDCAIPSKVGGRVIDPMGHVKMMAAVQPFLSGAISKTVNMPSDATVEDVADIYMQAWNRGLKCIAIYRDGCKRSQPMNAKAEDIKTVVAPTAPPARRKLPTTRQSITHRFSVSGVDGYLTMGVYPDGTPGEMFVTISKEGSTISGLMDGMATGVSLGLQYGVPLDVFAEKLSYSRFEPAGFTGNPELPQATSLIDYIFRWAKLTFPNGRLRTHEVAMDQIETPSLLLPVSVPTRLAPAPEAPTCLACGSMTVRSGSCYACQACGSTSGCS